MGTGRALFAGKNFCPFAACVAFDKTAPVEFTVALPYFGVLVGVVSTTATHEVATIYVWRGAVTEPTLSPHAPCGAVFLAVVWRSLNEHQIRIHGFLVIFDFFDGEESGLA